MSISYRNSPANPAPSTKRPPRNSYRSYGCFACGCWPIYLVAAILGVFSAIFFFAPGRTNILLLGIDGTPAGSDAGRSDTNILSTFLPAKPYIGMVSIPRDLWVNIEGYGQNRINTAHFFAEAEVPGSGPGLAMRTIQNNFGVTVNYYLRIKFEGFKDVLDAMGGVNIELSQPIAGYEAGMHHLTGRKALAFARNRTGSDDFYRMGQGQIILKAAYRQMIAPQNWWRFPAVLVALVRSIDTNIPIWLWPRLGFNLLRVGPGGIESRMIDRNMVTGTITDQGASVLLPNWERINPLLLEIFGQ